jgi:two-component system nitrate/nitrite response regulator NarL
MDHQLTESSHVRIVIADDHTIFRDGLRKLLESEPAFAVVGEAEDGVEAINVAQALEPDVLLLDLAMPRMGGLDSLAAMRGLQTRVIILTAAISEAAILRAIQLGARGVVLKEVATRQLLENIRRVVNGECVMGGEVLDDLVDAIRRPGSDPGRRYNLTPRELDIIAAVVAGQTNKEIANQLSISIQTVKHHLTSVFDKTGVSSRLELALFAMRHQLVNED